MRNVIAFMHISLDGFAAGPNGEMDWITTDKEIFQDAIDLTNTVDTAQCSINLKLINSKRFSSGVVGLHYQKA